MDRLAAVSFQEGNPVMSKDTTRTSTARQPAFRTPGPHLAESQPQPAEDLMCYLRNYARERPDVAALWCFGIGFVLGWKLKPW